jgi:hypothetical protein
MPAHKEEIWKFCYWLDDTVLSQLKSRMAEQGIAMVQAEKNPCEALKGEIGYAEPHTWDIICKYDAAPWYHTSKHAGKNLVVSSFSPGEAYTPFLETTIVHTSFKPADLPSKEELSILARDDVYLSQKPEDWGTFPREMGEAIIAGLTKMTGKSFGTFDDLLVVWDAVHANFVKPRYRAGEDFNNAPYSVADSTRISTCCAELFNLLDSQEDSLLVRPCTGSVILEVLEKDRYYLASLRR